MVSTRCSRQHVSARRDRGDGDAQGAEGLGDGLAEGGSAGAFAGGERTGAGRSGGRDQPAACCGGCGDCQRDLR